MINGTFYFISLCLLYSSHKALIVTSGQRAVQRGTIFSEEFGFLDTNKKAAVYS